MSVSSKLKQKLAKVIDSVVVGRPVYICNFPDQCGISYHEVDNRSGNVLLNKPLQVIPLTMQELGEAEGVIAEARKVYQTRVLLRTQQNKLYTDVNPIVFKAAIKTIAPSREGGNLLVELVLEEPLQDMDTLQNLPLKFTSSNGVDYFAGVVSLIRKDTLTMNIAYPKTTYTLEDMKWVNHLKGDTYTVSVEVESGVGKEEILLGPSLTNVVNND